jgi:hypothetical protein
MSNNFLLTFKGYLTQNINPSLGLSNRTPVIYHSLTLSPLEDMHSVMGRMVNNDGSDIFLKFQPTYIHVEVPTLDPVLFQHKSLFKDKVVIPVKLKSQAEEHKIHFPLKNNFITVKGKAHAVVLDFAITVHEMQGQTCSRLVLHINQRPFKPSLTYHGIYVALSRVRTSRHLRLLPLQPFSTNFNYLSELHPPKTLTQCLGRFNTEGIWSV